jgi:hypothetical protein
MIFFYCILSLKGFNRKLSACAAEAALPALGIGKAFYCLPRYALVGSDYHLRNPHAVFYHKSFLRKIDQRHTNFTAIIGIYRPHGVDKANAMFYRQATARAYLCFIARWKLDE